MLKGVSVSLGFLIMSFPMLAGIGIYPTIPNYSCYRTVDGTYQTAIDLVAQYPNLAEWIDIGDSWEKSVGRGGSDLMVLKLTNKSTKGPKPVFFANSAIHAREYATTELMTRFAEQLIKDYGKDADTTWLLDYHEAHFLLVTNPDGRRLAERQVMWRKNTNDSYCRSDSGNRGVDLNRNFDFEWGSAGSTEECSETYMGPGAASEPETLALQNYLRSLFSDQRGPARSDAAPRDTTGIYFDIHSYGEVIYQPINSPNNQDIVTLNRKLAFFNGYEPVLDEKYPDDLDTDHLLTDVREPHGAYNFTYAFGYGDLGVPSYLIELGTAFFQDCASFETKIVPKNSATLKYALKAARAAYMQPSGPEVFNLAATKGEASTLQLRAKVSDQRFSQRSGIELSQNIAAAEYYLDTPPWLAAANSGIFAAADGSFNGADETLEAKIDTSKLDAGRHILYARAKDVAGNWGAVSAVFFVK